MIGRRGLAAALAVLAVLATSACDVRTDITVSGRPDGHGTVTVTVDLDHQAAQAVGNVSAQLDTAGLAAAGWRVRPPRPGPGGSVVMSASHPFSAFSEVRPIVDEVAGSGGRPFDFTLRRQRRFWTTTTRFQGISDLRCGLGCFGDASLERQLGSPTGVDPAVAARHAGVQADSVFHFAVTVTLPGRLQSTNAPYRAGDEARWTPTLGHRLAMTATTSRLNVAPVAAVAGAAALVVGVSVAGAAVGRRRRRPGPRHRRRRHGDGHRSGLASGA